MKNFFKIFCLCLLFSAAGVLLFSFSKKNNLDKKNLKFPYRQAGLTERQAAVHLLNRFTFGPRQGQIDQVVNMGLEKWFRQQLEADLPDLSLNQRLLSYETLEMDNQQILQTFPKGGQVKKMAIKEGIIQRDDINKVTDGKKTYRRTLRDYMEQKGFRPQRELVQELIEQKILRASYSENQLQEVLTSFWFNHFNVSFTDKDCTPFITTYERDVIRPNVLEKFETILLATAQSPAMLAYLDNYKSSAEVIKPQPAGGRKEMNANGKIKKPKVGGINENYAREVMELHTLGVDGGYTQQDVTQAARVLTGWTFRNARRPASTRDRMSNGRPKKQGLGQAGDFFFAANKHDTSEKVVLGTRFQAGGGYEEGVKLLKMLAHHPATARFISTKLAVRFVSDNPSESLIDKMTQTFQEKDGDIRQVLLTMVYSPEFWTEEVLHEKTKSPLELAVSSLRSLDADLQKPIQLSNWITKMGEKMYYYQAPTGFPDKGQYWINTGSLLNRMNFGLAVASGNIKGVKIDLAAMNQNREPESAEATLFTYSQFLLPERELNETIKRLTSALHDPEFRRKVDAATGKLAAPNHEDTMILEEMPDESMWANEQEKMLVARPKKKNAGKENIADPDTQEATGTNAMLSQVVGIIIGSPEFQRK